MEQIIQAPKVLYEEEVVQVPCVESRVSRVESQGYKWERGSVYTYTMPRVAAAPSVHIFDL